MDLPHSSYHDSLKELWDEEEEPEEIEAMMKVVPSAYHHSLDASGGDLLFIKPRFRYTEGLHFREFGESFHISTSSSSIESPVYFVKKKDGGLRLCVDYHKRNAVTRKNKYPVLPINKLLTVFNGSSIFSKIDLCPAYNLLRIKEGGEHLTFFRTKYGSYEYFFMPFGLTNASASFQNLVNYIFQDLLDVYVVVYLDVIMFFSKSEEEHVTNVSTVLARVRANDLFS
ncbi:hypothetical protein O181_074826 [Austropuccinia psidii MF-1]|uniref:Reverse transcriptase domain-containing protein n=1 Tax=Austropuccinia psidii MF-1 TaxID=1389203 RepID=A0A9Q3F7B0_9BASI|nr:hypothetical protein [Austropuccinia psidii MF-1]